jgi:hypothetical protein
MSSKSDPEGVVAIHSAHSGVNKTTAISADNSSNCVAKAPAPLSNCRQRVGRGVASPQMR